MSENNSDESEEEAEPITFEEIMEFAEGQIGRELDQVDAEVPDHGAELVVTNASNLLKSQTALRFEESRAENEESFEARPEEERRKDLEEAVVEILLAIGALVHENDLDVADAFRERRDFTESFNAFQDEAADADTHEEIMEAADKHLDEEIGDVQPVGGQPMSIEPGDNVDDEDYDAEDDRDRHIA